VLSPLRQASLERQGKLEEFTYLRRNVEWFKARQEQDTISVNLEDRQKQKAADDEFRKEMKAEKERLSKNEYSFKPYYVGLPPPPRIKAPKKEGDEEDEFGADADENDTYVKGDVHLRETLRVLSDAVTLGQNRERWATSRPPLTASSGG
jgi:carboxyl-terminal processing protease